MMFEPPRAHVRECPDRRELAGDSAEPVGPTEAARREQRAHRREDEPVAGDEGEVDVQVQLQGGTPPLRLSLELFGRSRQ